MLKPDWKIGCAGWEEGDPADIADIEHQGWEVLGDAAGGRLPDRGRRPGEDGGARRTFDLPSIEGLECDLRNVNRCP